MIPFLLLASLTLPRPPLPEPLPSPNETVVWVWDSSCIKKVEKKRDTYMEAPSHNGEPDMKHSRVFNLVIDYVPGCGRIEIRKEK